MNEWVNQLMTDFLSKITKDIYTAILPETIPLFQC